MFGYLASNDVTRSASCCLAASSAVGSRPATVMVTCSSPPPEVDVSAAKLPPAEVEGVDELEPASLLLPHAANRPRDSAPATASAVIRGDLIVAPLRESRP